MTDIRIGQPPSAPEVPPRRRHWPLVAAVAVGALAIAGGLVAGGVWLTRQEKAPVVTAPTAEPIHVQGNLVLEDSDGWHKDGTTCVGDGGYDDIHAGAQVVVRNQRGETIGVGNLIDGKVTGGQCWFYFNVDVPAGEKFYSVEISHRGEVSYSAEDVTHPLWVSLGG